MSEKEQFDQFEAWWKTLNIYDPTLKALCGSAWMQAIRSTSVTTPAECENDPWVTQDRVPPRKDIDQICWGGGDWHSDWHKEWQFENMMHGDYPRFGGRLNVRCRRRDLPPVEQAQLDVIGTLSFDPATGEYSRTPQPQKTRVRLWIEGPTKMVMCRDKAPYGDWQELHHDSEGFYVEQGQ